MSHCPQQVLDMLRMPDPAYLAVDAQRLGALQLRLAASRTVPPPGQAADETSLFVLAAAAPAVADLADQAQLPLLAAIRQSSLRDWEVRLSSNLHVACAHTGSGHTMALQQVLRGSMRNERAELSREGPSPAGSSVSVTDAVLRLDLLPRSRRPWAEGVHLIALIDFDRASNPVTIRIEGPATPIEAQASPPASGGWARIDDLGARAGEAAHVTGRFEYDDGATSADASTPGRWKANIGLILVQLDAPTPRVFNLTVPCSREGRRTSADFAVDLRKLGPPDLLGEYRLYLFAGDQFVGPATVVIDA